MIFLKHFMKTQVEEITYEQIGHKNFSVFKRHISVSVDHPPELTLEFLGCLNEHISKLT